MKMHHAFYKIKLSIKKGWKKKKYFEKRK